MNKTKKHISVDLSFQSISLPPFQDILVITKKTPYGKLGVSGSLNLLQPDIFDVIEIDDELVELLVVNKRILKKISMDRLLAILKNNVFNHLSIGEVVSVDLKIQMSLSNISIEDDAEK